MGGGVSIHSATVRWSPSSLPPSSSPPYTAAAAAGSTSASGRATTHGVTAAAAACTGPAAAGGTCAGGGLVVGGGAAARCGCVRGRAASVDCTSASQQPPRYLPPSLPPPTPPRSCRDGDDEVHGADDELPIAHHGYGAPAGGAAASGAMPWDVARAAGAALPLGHLGREKAGNAEITPLQVGGAAALPCQLPRRLQDRPPSHPICSPPAAAEPELLSQPCCPAVLCCAVPQVDPSVSFDTVGGLDHYIKVGTILWVVGSTSLAGASLVDTSLAPDAAPHTTTTTPACLALFCF